MNEMSKGNSYKIEHKGKSYKWNTKWRMITIESSCIYLLTVVQINKLFPVFVVHLADRFFSGNKSSTDIKSEVDNIKHR